MRRQEEHRKLEELAKQEEMKRRQIDWEIAQRVSLESSLAKPGFSVPYKI